MLGIKQIYFPYAEVDGTNKKGEAFFFGNPCEHPELVYTEPFREEAIPPSCLAANIYNRDKIIELTDLKSLLIKNVKLRDNLGKTEEGDNHPLQQKIIFIKELIDETAISYLKYINRLMWVDSKKWNNLNKSNMTDFGDTIKSPTGNRWRETGISFDTAIEFCKAMTRELTSFFSLMIDLRYDAGILHDKLESDFTSLVNDYRLKSGFESKQHKHKKR